MRRFFRSLIFNIVFYIYTAFCCLVLTFAFFLPRKAAFQFVRFLYFKGIAQVERIFLGLNYRVTGRENLPKEGSYILAVKHYSAYETLKVPVIFGDIAIILKRELTWIPFWGWYTIKTGMIPVDRGGGHVALASIVKGGKRVVAAGRPILIFPQGTRVQPTDTTKERPYKFGIAKLAEELKLPIVPVAINSAAFWPKHSFMKKSGTVDFKILPAIAPGLPASETLKRLESVLEPASNELMQHPDIAPYGPRWIKYVLFLAIAFGAWASWWHKAASSVHDRLATLPVTSPYKPQIDGFPGVIRVTWPDVTYQSPSGTLNLPVFEAQAWPVPMGRGEFFAPQGFTLDATRKNKPVHVAAQTLSVRFSLPAPGKIDLTGIDLTANGTTISGNGKMTLPTDPQTPVDGKLTMSVDGYNALLDNLRDQHLIDKNASHLAGGFFDAMALAQQHPGHVNFELNVRDDVVYAGFIRLVDLKDMRAPVDQSGAPPQKIHSGGSATDGHQALDPQMLNPALPPQ